MAVHSAASASRAKGRPATGGEAVAAVLDALPHPVITVDTDGRVHSANLACESFFSTSADHIRRAGIDHFFPFASPVGDLVARVIKTGAPISEYRVDLSSPRTGEERIVDVFAAPVAETPGHVVVQFQLRTMADKMDRQWVHRGAARTVTGLAAMLAHEIKNPLSGIRGAAQLLESAANDEDRKLTRLITEEADRITRLVDRMEVFSDDRPLDRAPVNIHVVLDHVKALAASGFGEKVKFREAYDPSLPPVYGNRDQLIQVFVNLVKNACEALDGIRSPTIRLSTAFKPGMRVSVPASRTRVSVPLEICVDDNGPGVPETIAGNLFDPFITSRVGGSGLGLALVAKLVGDHGGVVEHEAIAGGARFRVLLPAWEGGFEPAGDTGKGG